MSGPLVETWGVRYRGNIASGYYSREHAERHKDDEEIVVPLVAADRLTDEVLVEVLARAQAGLTPDEQWDDATPSDDEYRSGLTEQARNYLAALRAHIEQTGADA